MKYLGHIIDLVGGGRIKNSLPAVDADDLVTKAQLDAVAGGGGGTIVLDGNGPPTTPIEFILDGNG
jgi:hypothetical protein